MNRHAIVLRSRAVRVVAGVLLLGLAACQPATPPPRAPAPAAAAKPAPAPAAKPASSPATATAAAAKAPAVALPSTALPPGPIYACEVAGKRTVIEFPENVENLCRRHPEMGPCQYERNVCRGNGGRVFTMLGEEVTPAVEAAYDEKVRRVRFQADGGGGSAKR